MKAFRDKAIVFLATGAWIGFSPVAPGTFGSLAALPFCLLLSLLGHGMAAFCLLLSIGLAVWAAHHAEKIIGRNDPGSVVIDEICGMAVAMFALPFTLTNALGAFALFRVFDILKPFPVRWADRQLSGGIGIVMDDLIAGLFTNLVLRMGMAMFQ